MELPKLYTDRVRDFGFDEISLGYCGVQLCSPNEFREWQVGYSISSSGESFVDSTTGSWKDTWAVIGRETSLGEPIFLDSGNPNLPVITAMHGEGAWEPQLIADSLSSFFACLKEFQTIAVNRRNPVELENNPIKEKDRRSFLAKIKSLNGEPINLEFWDILIGSTEPLDSAE